MLDSLLGSQPRVICVGMAAQDYIWYVSRIPVQAGKSQASDFLQMGGGMAATAAVTIARLGGHAELWGSAGQDPEGYGVRDELENYGVDVSHFILDSEARTPVSGILVDSEGERLIVNYRGEQVGGDPASLPLAALKGASAVLVDMRWPRAAVSVCDAAQKLGIVTVLDADVAEPRLYDDLLPYVSDPIFSEPGLAAFAPGYSIDDGLRLAAERAQGWAAVTRGASGTRCCIEGVFCNIPAFTVTVIDSTGAGDVFHGAFAHARGANTGISEALCFASAVAAVKCTARGGRVGIPSMARALDFLEELA